MSAEQHIRFELLVEDVLRVCCLEASESRGTKRLATHVRNCFFTAFAFFVNQRIDLSTCIEERQTRRSHESQHSSYVSKYQTRRCP